MWNITRARVLTSTALLGIIGLPLATCAWAADPPSKSKPPTQSVFAEFSGEYLDQDPPGMKPELFAPELLSLGFLETNISFTPDGMSFSYTVITGGDQILREPKGPFGKLFILHSFVDNGHWTEPVEFSFLTHRMARYPNFSPDGRKLFFNSRPERTGPPDTLATDMWYVEKRGRGWTEPREVRFHGEFSGKRVGVYPTVAANGNLYFAIFADGRRGVLHMSKYENGKYLAPRSLQAELQNHGNHPCISPDESFILFDWEHPDENYGTNDILISFRDENGKWEKAQNLGALVNTPYNDWRPFLSFDGKYLFFSSNRIDSPELGDQPVSLSDLRQSVEVPADGYQHLYWVDARVIEEAKFTGILYEAIIDHGVKQVKHVLENLKRQHGHTFDFDDKTLGRVANRLAGNRLFEPYREVMNLNFDLYPYSRTPGKELFCAALGNDESTLTLLEKSLSEGGTAGGAGTLSENDINAIGYRLSALEKHDEAIHIFLMNTRLHPASGNAYDSLAEGYMNSGQKERAIANYNKSLELDPDNNNAVEMLARLQE